MTFPVVAATNTSIHNSVTSHTVNLPATISAGDLLIVLFAYNNLIDDLVGIPSGWTEFINFQTGNIGRLHGFYKVASGSEGATLSVSTNSILSSAHNSYRITGYSSVPEAATASGASSTTPDPPSLSPSWGARDTLWVAVAHCINASTDLAAPTNYGGLVQSALTDANRQVGSANRQLNAASEDPGTFTGASNNQWGTATIAVQPVAAGVAGKMDNYRRRRAA